MTRIFEVIGHPLFDVARRTSRHAIIEGNGTPITIWRSEGNGKNRYIFQGSKCIIEL